MCPNDPAKILSKTNIFHAGIVVENSAISRSLFCKKLNQKRITQKENIPFYTEKLRVEMC